MRDRVKKEELCNIRQERLVHMLEDARLSNDAMLSKKTKRIIKSKAICNEYKTRKRYKCPHCKRTFKQAQALGGHISKAHPNCSIEYQ